MTRPLFSHNKEIRQPYVDRWKNIFFTALVMGSLALGTFLSVNEEQASKLPKNTTYYVVKPGDTPWSIASDEGPQVADNEAKLYQQIKQIEEQIPKDQDGNLIPGEIIYLPSGSKNAAPIVNSQQNHNIDFNHSNNHQKTTQNSKNN